CSSPDTLSTLSDGSHTFSVRASSGGLTDQTPATQSFTVDTIAPQTTIDTGPTGTVNSNAATFTFHASEAGSFQCKLDGGSFSAPVPAASFHCSLAAPVSPHGSFPSSTTSTTYSTPAAGVSPSFAFRAASGGTPDPSPATATFTVDTTAPQTTIDTGPIGTVN